jgi:hypothetical protein
MQNRKTKFDAEKALRMLAVTERMIDATLTEEERQALALRERKADRREAEGVYDRGADLLAAEGFDLLATADALGALEEKLRAIVEVRQETLTQKMLDAYYATETIRSRAS